MARLVFQDAQGTEHAWTLPAYAIVLGRDEACDLVVDDQRASRQHACIRLHAEQWRVRDLGSANGTYVDGRRVDDWVELRDGATIRIGRTVLRLALDEPEAPAAAAASGAFPEIPGHDVVGVLGQGATGTVYRARHRALDRFVAVKVLSPKLARRADMVDRFVREARAAAALSHPHVVPVFDVTAYGGLHFFCMEFMEGGTVEDRLLAAPESRLPWREAVRYVAQAAAGLAHLHEHGLVHRDVKPANLLLDARRVVRLGDMGTVVRVDEAAGERIGTPHYMSPEQARRRPVTRASDVYSLGATLYRMLAGRPPHHGATVQEIVEDVAHGTPPPLGRIRPDVPAEVVGLVEEMMADDPAARPADAADLGRRLEETLQEVKASAAAARRGRRVRASLVGWVVAALVVGAAVLAYYRRDLLLERLRGARAAETPSPPSVLAPAAASPAARTPLHLASEAYDQVRAREKALDPPSARNAAEWRAVAADYARLAEVFPLDAEPVVRGHWRAKEIRDRLRELTGGDAEHDALSERWVTRALRDVPAAARGPVAEGGGGGPLLAALVAERDALLRRADERVASRDVQGALDLVLEWVRKERLAANGSRAPTEVHEAIAEGIRWMRRTTKAASARLEADLARDRALLRTRLPQSALFRPGAPVQRPAEAAAPLRALDPLLVTYLGGDLVAARLERLDAMEAVWDAVKPQTGARGPAAAAEVVAATVRALPTLEPTRRAGAVWLLVEAGAADPAAVALAQYGRYLPQALRTAAEAEILALRDPRTAGPHASLLAGGDLAAHPVFAPAELDAYFETWGGVPAAGR